MFLGRIEVGRELVLWLRSINELLCILLSRFEKQLSNIYSASFEKPDFSSVNAIEN